MLIGVQCLGPVMLCAFRLQEAEGWQGGVRGPQGALAPSMATASLRQQPQPSSDQPESV